MRAGNALRRHLPSLQNHTRHKNATPISCAPQPRQPGYAVEAYKNGDEEAGATYQKGIILNLKPISMELKLQ